MANKILLIAVSAWAAAQVLKLLIAWAVYRKLDLTYLTTGGGMPSSHSALVCACAVSAAFETGLDSPVFAVAAVLAFIVMYDAAHVRLETGKQAKVLNQLMRNLGEGRPETFEEDLKELIGHTPLQVAVGAVILNRVRHPSFPNSVSGVIYQPGAFSALDDGQYDQPVADSSRRAAQDAMSGWDPTDGAIYYYNPAKTTNQWIYSRPVVARIGDHVFAV